MRDNNRPSWWIRFFSNPVVGIVGTLASITGVVLAVIFYFQSVRERELTYYVHPVKTIVVKAGQSSKLDVTVDGQGIKSDVTATQIAIWNAGREAIRREHVLRPLVIQTAGGVPIIDASIRKTTRNVVGMSLDTSQASNGKLVVSWDILEKDDGGVVQVVYAGDPDEDIIADATLEGQHTLAKFSAPPKLHIMSFMVLGGIVIAGVLLLLCVRLAIALSASRRAILLVLCVLLIALEIADLVHHGVVGPPFGF
jgi:hypothetical protein